MLETIGEENIYRMSVEEPEKNESDWIGLDKLSKDDISSIRKHAQAEKKTISNIPIIVSELRSLGIEDEISSGDLKSLHSRLERLKNEASWEEFTRLAASIKEAGGDPKLNSQDLSRLESVVEVHRHHAKKRINKADREEFEYTVVNMLCYLRIIGRDAAPTELEVEYILRRFNDRVIFKETTSLHEAKWARLAHILGVEVPLTHQDISEAQNRLQVYLKERDWNSYMALAYYMKYLSEHLPELKGDPELASTISGMPIEREF